ncbi:putative orfan [Tupanvirus soda lake]|uniref:Orfan n=2 Tax=Tupanvirus TaxID=2094720 RepID=A0AC62ACW4_9VIRU|nr:putative orfan [Tupanvirus soda lake]QKU35630.1 putative orfan [Tupanvirus soda lake]
MNIPDYSNHYVTHKYLPNDLKIMKINGCDVCQTCGNLIYTKIKHIRHDSERSFSGYNGWGITYEEQIIWLCLKCEGFQNSLQK